MEQKDRDLLVRLDANFRSFMDDWEAVKQNGFVFCATRQAQIDETRRLAIWTRNTVLALIFALLTAAIGYLADGRANAEIKQPAEIDVSTVKTPR